MFGKFILALVLTSTLFCIVFKSTATADPAQNIGIGPAIISENINPGSTVNGNLDISNEGANSYAYSIYASPYGVNNETYQPVFKTLPGFTNITSWFSFSQSSGVLTPNKPTAINYTIAVPPGTPPGSYYGAVFTETNPVGQSTKSDKVLIKQRVGSLFYININGSAYQNGSVNSWHAPFFQSSPVNASLKLANSGKLYYVTNVNVNFEDLLGNVKYQYQTQKIVIPKVVRNIPIVWPKPPIFGLYKVKGTATIYGKKQLSTHYVLIASNSVRVVFVIIIFAIIMYLGLQNVYVNVRKSKSKRQSNE